MRIVGNIGKIAIDEVYEFGFADRSGIIDKIRDAITYERLFIVVDIHGKILSFRSPDHKVIRLSVVEA
jgi:hypothetical protein